MRVDYFKDEHRISIEFQDPAEQLLFQKMIMTWTELDERLEEPLKMIGRARDKSLTLTLSKGEGIKALRSRAINRLKKKEKWLRIILKKIFLYDLGDDKDLTEFVQFTGIMAEIGRLINEAITKGDERKVISKGNQMRVN